MKNSLSTLAILAATTLPFAAQTALASDPAAKPMFTVLPAHGTIHQYAHRPASLLTWNGTITYSGKNYNYSMVGTNPASTNTTIATWVQNQ